jgi:hypothetical protein
MFKIWTKSELIEGCPWLKNLTRWHARIRENPKKCLFVFPTEKPGKLTFKHDEIVNIIHKIKVQVLKLFKNVWFAIWKQISSKGIFHWQQCTRGKIIKLEIWYLATFLSNFKTWTLILWIMLTISSCIKVNFPGFSVGKTNKHFFRFSRIRAYGVIELGFSVTGTLQWALIFFKFWT